MGGIPNTVAFTKLSIQWRCAHTVLSRVSVRNLGNGDDGGKGVSTKSGGAELVVKVTEHRQLLPRSLTAIRRFVYIM